MEVVNVDRQHVLAIWRWRVVPIPELAPDGRGLREDSSHSMERLGGGSFRATRFARVESERPALPVGDKPLQGGGRSRSEGQQLTTRATATPTTAVETIVEKAEREGAPPRRVVIYYLQLY